jgi:hypothetical protein
MLTAGYLEPVPDMVSPYTKAWGFMDEALAPAPPGAGTYEAADRGIYYPLYVPTTCVARRMWWVNGGTATGNIEAGIYLDAGYKPGVKLVTTGTIGQSGTSAVQFADITDTTLAPGLHWLYLSCSSTSSTFLRTSSLTHYDELYRWDQASIGPGSAPDPAVPTESDSDQTYFVGFSTTTIT